MHFIELLKHDSIEYCICGCLKNTIDNIHKLIYKTYIITTR